MTTYYTKPTVPDTIGDRIRKMRLLRCMTQQTLGHRSGLGQSAISALECGRTRWMRGGNLLIVAEILECSPAWLETGAGADIASIARSADDAAVLKLASALSAKNRHRWMGYAERLIEEQKAVNAQPAAALPSALARQNWSPMFI